MSNLTIPGNLYAPVMQLVNDHGYSVEDAIAKAAADAARTRQNRPHATEGAKADHDTGAGSPTPQRASKRRRTPQRDPMPENAGISPLNEKQFQGMVEYLFRSEGWLVFHPYDSRRSEPGFPDVYAVHPDRGVVQAELKMPNGRVSKAQQKWLDTIRAAGYRAYLWYPNDWHDIEAIAQGKQS